MAGVWLASALEGARTWPECGSPAPSMPELRGLNTEPANIQDPSSQGRAPTDLHRVTPRRRPLRQPPGSPPLVFACPIGSVLVTSTRLSNSIWGRDVDAEGHLAHGWTSATSLRTRERPCMAVNAFSRGLQCRSGAGRPARLELVVEGGGNFGGEEGRSRGRRGGAGGRPAVESGAAGVEKGEERKEEGG